MIHLGNVPASSTLYIPFTTYGKSNGESITCSGLAVTDVEIYKNGSTTQRASDAGIALLDTDGIDFDSITGLHGFSIDLSDNTDASFYSVGAWYWVVVSAITVDSQTVTFLAATFRIAPAEAITGHPKTDIGGWLGTAPATPTVAGVPEVDLTHVNGSVASGVATPDVNVASVDPDAIDGDAIAASAVTKVQSGLATAAQVSSLQVNTRTNIQVPIEIEIPDASTQVWKIRMFLFDSDGNMEAPDSTPTIALTNAAGTDRSSRLSSATVLSTGAYSWDYTATAGDAEEQLVWVFTVVEGGLTRIYPATSYVVEETAYRFSSTDRSTLNAAATAAALATVSGKIDTIDGIVDTLLADLINGGRLDLILDAILADATLARQILGNKHTVVESPTGTFTISVRNDADDATVRTIVYVAATGARTVS